MPDTFIKAPKLDIHPDLREDFKAQSQEEGQVIVHCSYQASMFFGDLIRIWPTTFLFDCDSPHRSQLVHFENISLYPEWRHLEAGEDITFTLIFTGLPRSCQFFDLVEQIPQAGGFEIRRIRRNNTDVYHLKIT